MHAHTQTHTHTDAYMHTRRHTHTTHTHTHTNTHACTHTQTTHTHMHTHTHAQGVFVTTGPAFPSLPFIQLQAPPPNSFQWEVYLRNGKSQRNSTSQVQVFSKPSYEGVCAAMSKHLVWGLKATRHKPSAKQVTLAKKGLHKDVKKNSWTLIIICFRCKTGNFGKERPSQRRENVAKGIHKATSP